MDTLKVTVHTLEKVTSKMRHGVGIQKPFRELCKVVMLAFSDCNIGARVCLVALQAVFLGGDLTMLAELGSHRK